jgi:hypothetical protein
MFQVPALSQNDDLTEAAAVSTYNHTPLNHTLPTLYSSPLRSSTRWHSAICGPTEGTGRPMGMRQTGVRTGQIDGEGHLQSATA